MTGAERKKRIVRAGLLGIAANLLLSGFKLAVGLLSNSVAIVLDAVNNTGDMLSSAVTVAGAKMAGRPADKEHPLGHGRLEYLSAVIVSAVILYAGIAALIEAVRRIINPVTPDYSVAALAVVGAAVAVKLVLWRFFRREGERLHSDSLSNAGRDALLDVVISASTLLAAVVSLVFHVFIEAWIGLLIAGVIIRSGVGMFRATVSKILGERVESTLAQSIKQTICETEGVAGAYDLILNSYGPDQWLGSVNIEVPDTWTADRIDVVTRQIARRVAEKNHVILSAIGIYSQNSTNDEASRMRTRITEIVMSQPYVLQIHGIYCDLEEKTVRFDIVTDFQASDPKEVEQNVLRKLQEQYPDFTILIHRDADYSD